MKQQYLALILLLLLATGLRFHNIDAQSFWNDEGNSARLSERSVRLIIEGTASDVHPPLYYLILRGYRELVGESEFALRSVSAFAGIVLVALIVPLSIYPRRKQTVFSKQYSVFSQTIHTEYRIPNTEYQVRPYILIAALFVAVNPALVYYSQETRMYMLLPLWVILATVILLRWLESADLRSGLFISYVLVMAAGLYTHYFFPITFAIHGVICLLELDWRRLAKWGAGVSLSIASFTPWLPFVANGLGGNRGIVQPIDIYLENVVKWLTMGVTYDHFQDNLLPVVATVLAIALLTAIYLKQQSWHIWLLLMTPLMALPVVGATDVAFFKFVLFTVCGLAVIVARMIDALWRWHWTGRIVAVVVGLGLFTFNISSVAAQFGDSQFARADYRGMAARISAENHPNAGIILNAPNQWEVFTYYHKEGASVYPLPRSQDDDAVFAELNEIGATHDRLYVLYWGDAQQDPQHWVENWLAENAFKASEEWVKDVRFVVYALPDEGDLVMNSAEINFSNEIKLTEVGLNNDHFLAGDIIQTAFTWQAMQLLNNRYKIFVHLLDQNGQLVAQKDSEPQRMTLDWHIDEPILTQHGILIPADLPNGDYILTIGWYDISNPSERLPIFGVNENEQTYKVATIRIGN